MSVRGNAPFGVTLQQAADNDEIRMTNAERNPKSECTRGATSADSRVGISLYPYLSKSSQAAQSLVLVLVIGNGAVEGEDEKEDDDDLVAALPRCAVSQSFTLPHVGERRRVAPIRRSAEYNSATCRPAGRYCRLKTCATILPARHAKHILLPAARSPVCQRLFIVPL